MQRDLDRWGIEPCSGVIPAAGLEDMLSMLEPVLTSSTASRRRGEVYAARTLLTRLPNLSAVLGKLGIDRLASTALGSSVTAVDATFFDKNAGANWVVPSHQDVVVPASAVPLGTDSFERYGSVYSDAPDDVLRRMVAARIHFDDCPPENGALAVLPGSHRRRLRSDELAALSPSDFTTCAARAGDILLMSPLVVHRSSPALDPRRRRVLHVLYGPA
jgi:hypothetical protein